jgi:hypothetical protein
MDLEGSGLGRIERISEHVTGGTAENNKKKSA